MGHLPSTRFHASCYARHDLVFCFQLHHSSCVCSKLSPEMFSVERQRLVEFCKALVMDVSAVAPSPSRRPNDCPRHVSPASVEDGTLMLVEVPQHKGLKMLQGRRWSYINQSINQSIKRWSIHSYLFSSPLEASGVNTASSCMIWRRPSDCKPGNTSHHLSFQPSSWILAHWSMACHSADRKSVV